jgi:hypothetical protein
MAYKRIQAPGKEGKSTNWIHKTESAIHANPAWKHIWRTAAEKPEGKHLKEYASNNPILTETEVREMAKKTAQPEPEEDGWTIIQSKSSKKRQAKAERNIQASQQQEEDKHMLSRKRKEETSLRRAQHHNKAQAWIARQEQLESDRQAREKNNGQKYSTVSLRRAIMSPQPVPSPYTTIKQLSNQPNLDFKHINQQPTTRPPPIPPRRNKSQEATSLTEYLQACAYVNNQSQIRNEMMAQEQPLMSTNFVKVDNNNIYEVTGGRSHTQTGVPIRNLVIWNTEAATTDNITAEALRDCCTATVLCPDGNYLRLDPEAYYGTVPHYQHGPKAMAASAHNAGVRFKRPSDSNAQMLQQKEWNTRPHNLDFIALENINAMSRALYFTWDKRDRGGTNIFPYWDNDHIPDYDGGHAKHKYSIYQTWQDDEIPMPYDQRITYNRTFKEQGRDQRDSYWYTPKGQWRAKNTLSEAIRLLEMRDVLKEYEEKYTLMMDMKRNAELNNHRHMGEANIWTE